MRRVGPRRHPPHRHPISADRALREAGDFGQIDVAGARLAGRQPGFVARFLRIRRVERRSGWQRVRHKRAPHPIRRPADQVVDDGGGEGGGGRENRQCTRHIRRDRVARRGIASNHTSMW